MGRRDARPHSLGGRQLRAGARRQRTGGCRGVAVEAGKLRRGGRIAFYVGAPSAQNKVAGRPLWVLREDAQVALAKGGIAHAPNATVLQTWMRSCAPPGPVCQKGSLALKPYSVGLVTADATGHAQTPALPAGRYWVLSDAHIANRHVMWNQPVDVRGGDRSLTLDQRNAMPVD